MVLALSCTREAPKPAAPFLLEFRMPEACKAEARYKNQRVVFKGNLSYQFETDIAGMVTVDGLVPGIYDIITNWEMSGKEYKALLKDPAAAVEDKARVIVGVSLMNQRLFDARDMVIDLSAAVVKGLMISKVYYAGTKDKMGRNYGTDSYVEIFNNSDEVLYIDGKYLGLAESISPAAYPAHENPDSIYMRQICKFPGNGSEYPVQPGGSVVVAAKSARNHQESADNTVDLSRADFEVKVIEGSGNPDVPMLPIISNSTKIQTLNLINGGLNAVVLFETDEDVLSQEGRDRRRGMPQETGADRPGRVYQAPAALHRRRLHHHHGRQRVQPRIRGPQSVPLRERPVLPDRHQQHVGGFRGVHGSHAAQI